jgi:hypothetical protein
MRHERASAAMADDDDMFEVNAQGEIVLAGLTRSETLEFDRLERIIRASGTFPHISRDEWHSPDEKRWLELWDKHQAALAPFLESSKTRH